MIAPSCWVSVTGVRLTGLPSATAPQVLSGLSMPWGRSELFGQPDPATVTVEVFDPTATWAAGVDSRLASDRMGDALVIGWAHAGVEHTMFRGRIASISVTPAVFNGIDGARVLLTGVSRIADLAQQLLPVRPAELLRQRLDALQTQLSTYAGDAVTWITAPGSSAVTAGTETRNHFPQTLQPTAADTSTYAALVALYDATCSRLSYLPDSKHVCGIDRRTYLVERGLAGLVKAAAGEPRAGKGAYLASKALQQRNGQSGTVGSPGLTGRVLFLDGALTAAPDDAWLTRTAEQRAQHLDLTYRAATTYADATVTRGVATRALSVLAQGATVEVETVGATDAGYLADDYAGMLAAEGTDWVPAPIVWDTAFTGGFETLEQALDLLAGGETVSLIFLQRTGFPRIGQRPIFGVMGGTITHTAGTWRVELYPTPVHTVLPQHAISWDEIDNGGADTVYVYADGTLNAADGLHESVTAEDLMYCSTGVGVSVVPADSGWDTYR